MAQVKQKDSPNYSELDLLNQRIEDLEDENEQLRFLLRKKPVKKEWNWLWLLVPVVVILAEVSRDIWQSIWSMLVVK